MIDRKKLAALDTYRLLRFHMKKPVNLCSLQNLQPLHAQSQPMTRVSSRSRKYGSLSFFQSIADGDRLRIVLARWLRSLPP
jgi:hypothetical protein